MSRPTRSLLVILGGVVGVLTGCSAPPATSRASREPSHAVGVITETFVDHARITPANGDEPQLPYRTLVTTIWYPAKGGAHSSTPTEGAAPDRSDGPYPLIVFGHGLGATPEDYESLLSRWAAAGFVVAAPHFPLTSTNAPDGPDPNDVFSQPKDMSYIITSVLKRSAQSTGMLSSLVAPHEVGVAGHSEGAITALGFFNSCCRDDRIKAAEVLDGDPETYPSGEYHFDGDPPLLIVHGTDDSLLPFSQMEGVYNSAKGPKGLLALVGAGHVSWLAPSSKWFNSAVATTTDFFDVYLRGDKSALKRIVTDGKPGVSRVYFAPTLGSTTTVATAPQPKTHLEANVNPTRNLTDGQVLTVTWSGFDPGKVVNIVECSSSSAVGCDISGGHILTPDPTGKGTVSLHVVEGRVGNGICDAAHSGCMVLVNNAGLETPSATIRIPITFAP
jgi:dienelactone hydrolase